MRLVHWVISRIAKKGLGRNSLWALGGFLLRFGMKTAYFILAARALGSTEYGKFASIAAITTIFQPFSSWGSGNILVKFVARDRNTFSKYWGAALTVTVLSGLFFMALTLIVTHLILPPEIDWRSILLISGADLVFSRLTDIGVMAFLAVENFKNIAQLNVAPSILLAVSTAILAVKSNSIQLSSWAVLYFLSLMGGAIYALVCVYLKLGSGQLGLRALRGQFREGFYFSMSVSTQSVYNDIDKLFLANLSGLAVAGVYALAYKVVNMLFMPISALMYSAYPNFFRAGESGLEGAFRWATKLMRVAFLYSVVVVILTWLCSPVIPLILGTDYVAVGVILIWLAPLICLKSIHSFCADALTGNDQQSVRTSIQVGVAILNLILDVLLIPKFSWQGAAVASILSDGALAAGLLVVILVQLQRRRNRVSEA